MLCSAADGLRGWHWHVVPQRESCRSQNGYIVTEAGKFCCARGQVGLVGTGNRMGWGCPRRPIKRCIVHREVPIERICQMQWGSCQPDNMEMFET